MIEVNNVVYVDFQRHRRTEPVGKNRLGNTAHRVLDLSKALSRAEQEALFLELRGYASEVLKKRSRLLVGALGGEKPDHGSAFDV